MLIVQKYGGTSVASADRIRAAAARVAGLARDGAKVVVVVSAQGQTTDDMIARAAEISENASDREMDAYLSAGEQMAAGLMAMAIADCGVPAVALSGWQAGIQTDGVYGSARILNVDTARIRKELGRGNVAVVTGFQGISENGDITTLGRGGSDTSAVALAAYLHADRCQIITDVDGVYDRDPRVYPDAVRFDRISYEDMLKLIKGGARVLHDRSVELAQEHHIEVQVLSAFRKSPGTIVG